MKTRTIAERLPLAQRPTYEGLTFAMQGLVAHCLRHPETFEVTAGEKPSTIKLRRRRADAGHVVFLLAGNRIPYKNALRALGFAGVAP